MPQAPRASRRARGFAWVLALLLSACVGVAAAAQPPPSAGPVLVLWAWTTTDDLTFLADWQRTLPGPAPVEVAYLSGEILVAQAGLDVRPRHRRLRLPTGLPRTAVVYLAVDEAVRVPLPMGMRKELVRRILALPLVRDAGAVQLNYEPTPRRRPDWQPLVDELRRQMPARQQLDVAVLAGWCMDPAFAVPGARRVVPMLYRLGAVPPAMARVLDGSAEFPSRACRGAIGIATDSLEQVAAAFARTRPVVYVFAPGRWTGARWSSVPDWLRGRIAAD